MIVYSSHPQAIVKACLLSRLTGQTCQAKEEHEPSLFCGPDDIDADSYNLERLLVRCGKVFPEDLSWLSQTVARRLYGRVYYALRSSSPARFTVIENALRDALRYGPDYCLNSISADCRKFNNLAREVSGEVRRMLGLIRFSMWGEDGKTLVAQPRLYHNTADFILKRFSRRYPGCRLVLLLPEKALCLENGTIYAADPLPYRAAIEQKDPFDGVWEKYYRSQYIASRRNIRLASQHIPQRYWDWLAEGKVLQEVKNEK